MKTILKITNQTQEERNNLILESFLFWGGKHTDHKQQYQIVITNRTLQKWFVANYEKLEQEFLDFVKRHPNATTKDNERLYARIVGKIYDNYPSALLDDIKRKFKTIPIRNLN
ncbi:hypothetical protein MC378_10280 [Polaribacter sp. MSW13]|uniref:Uncharacterized protein n=1 Tax=Polaribacter marinus TaxID=2916838 RepID=A0A9X1VN20_9FLAO|nr:hypothetical protein [Polaribacter marinus]MCI2229554.1 hypothetical protein [Polaribacter marinus]